MNFTELKEEVQAIVKRPDLTNRIESAIRAATLKLHTTSFYPRDVREEAVAFTYPDVITNFDPRDIFPLFRKIAYIRWWNYDPADTDSAGRPGRLLTPAEMGDIVDYYGFPKLNIYYEAGTLIQIKTTQPLSHCLVGVYVFPKVTPSEEFESWVAEDYPWAIIYEAASKVFGQIGHTAQANAMQQEAGQQLVLLTMQSTKEPAIGSR